MQDVLPTIEAAIAAQRAGDLAAAEAGYRRALRADPDQPTAAWLLATLVLNARRFAQAVPLLRHAAALRPGAPEIRVNLAHALLGCGGAVEAAALCHTLLQQHPGLTPALTTLARARLLLGDPAGALAASARAVSLAADSADAWFLHAAALSATAAPAAAEAALETCLRLAPDHAAAWANRGNACIDQDRLEEAEAHLLRARALDPMAAETHASLGFLRACQGRLSEAVAACSEAIALRPNFAQAYWNRSFAHLLAGNYAAGWADYEWRKRHPLFAADFATPPGREWTGDALAGARLLVRAEQGLGDTLQLARYLPLLVAQGAIVTLACDPGLASLLAQLPITLRDKAADHPACDYWVDQMSLPRLCPGPIPSPGGYLRADPAQTAQWRARLPPRARTGLVWAGNPAHSNDRRRSLPFAAIAPLVAADPARFVSLQVGPRSAEAAAFGIADRSSALPDFAATAALIEALDLVIAVDTSTAHLAGALGKPVWLMLPYAPDWRWMTERRDSPWYASARLFRQPRPGDWPAVIAEVAAALRPCPYSQGICAA